MFVRSIFYYGAQISNSDEMKTDWVFNGKDSQHNAQHSAVYIKMLTRLKLLLNGVFI